MMQTQTQVKTTFNGYSGPAFEYRRMGVVESVSETPEGKQATSDFTATFMEEANKLGAEGWDLVAVFPFRNGIEAYFKRCHEAQLTIVQDQQFIDDSLGEMLKKMREDEEARGAPDLRNDPISTIDTPVEQSTGEPTTLQVTGPASGGVSFEQPALRRTKKGSSK